MQQADSYASNGTRILTINGGNITIDADGDGIDVNGSVAINGGYTIVYGPENSGNGALDYDGTFAVNGGTLIASGSSGMAMGISDSSTVYSIMIGTSGGNLVLKDSNGNEVLSFTSDKNYQNLVFASDTLQANETYTAYSGSSELGSVTVSSTNNYINASGGMGQGMGPGNGQQPPSQGGGQAPGQKP